jgi:WD40 repeat protein
MGIIVSMSVLLLGFLQAYLLSPHVGQEPPFEIVVPQVFWSVAYNPDGKTVATCGSGDTSIQLWDVGTGKKIATLDGHSGKVYCVAYSPDGKLLASGDSKNTILLWDLTTKRHIKTIEGIPQCPCTVLFNPTGKVLGVGCFGGTLQLWDVDTGKCVVTLQGHTDYVSSLAFTPDGKSCASGSKDRSLRLWDASTGKEQWVFTHTAGLMAVAFTSDGKSLLSGFGDGTVRRWNLATRSFKAVKLQHSSLGFGSMAFSPDGKWCATGESWFNADKQAGVTVWDITTGKVITRANGHKTKVLDLKFSHDGKHVVSVGGDTEFHLITITQVIDK